MMKGLQLTNSTFSTLGVELHLGKGETAAKTEVMYIPGAYFYNSPAPETTTLLEEAPVPISPENDTVDDDNNHLTPTSKRILEK